MLAPVADPIAEVLRWYEAAVAAKIPQAEAMALATATPDGRPSLRIVLYKPGGDAIRFFTNYESRKGAELARNPHVAATFWWEPLGRQIRIEGRASRLPRAESEAYFATRPRESQLGAWASAQSRELTDRVALEAALRAVEARFGAGPVPCPQHWGGYRIDPDSIELWAARPARLHDRLRYTRGGPTGDAWACARLQP
jgi:pyridoxamine 5'-phosphate oxidase